MARRTHNLLAVEKRYGVWAVKQPLRPTKYHFGTETKPYRVLSKRSYADALQRQEHEPVKLHDYVTGVRSCSVRLTEPPRRRG